MWIVAKYKSKELGTLKQSFSKIIGDMPELHGWIDDFPGIAINPANPIMEPDRTLDISSKYKLAFGDFHDQIPHGSKRRFRCNEQGRSPYLVPSFQQRCLFYSHPGRPHSRWTIRQIPHHHFLITGVLSGAFGAVFR